MAEVTWTPEALRHLDDIVEYFGSVAPQYGSELTLEIENALDSLERFPLIGRAVPQMSRDDLREVIIDNFRLVYLVRAEGLRVVALLHGTMDVVARLRRLDLNS